MSTADSFFFFNDTATTEIYTLSLHDALPISLARRDPGGSPPAAARRPVRDAAVPGDRAGASGGAGAGGARAAGAGAQDRKSTRLNSSHDQTSYAVFCLKKKTYLDLILSHHVA